MTPFLLIAGLVAVLSAPGLCLEWGPEQPVGGDDNYDDMAASVTATPDGQIWVTWTGHDPAQMDHEIYFSVNDGSGWSLRARVHEDNAVDDAIAEMDSGTDGVPWVIWSRGQTDGYDLMVSHWEGSWWTAPEVIRAAGDRYDSYAIHVESSSDIWVVTDAFVEGHAARWLLVYHWDGLVWSEPWLVGHPGTDRGPAIRVAPDGRPWLVWIAFGLSGEPVNSVAYSVFENGAWSAPAVVNGEPGNGGLGPEILFDSDGTPIVVWEGNGHIHGFDIEYSRLVDGSWTPAELVSEPETWVYAFNGGLHSDQALGSSPWVFWISGDNADFHAADVTVCEWRGTGWGPEEAPCDTTYGKVDSSGDIAVAADGSLWAAWEAYVEVPPYDYFILASQGSCLTPVEFCCLEAERCDGSVVLTWQASGSASSGPFLVWRASSPDTAVFGPRPSSSASVLAGTWTRSGNNCSWVDGGADAVAGYAYWIEWSAPGGLAYLGPCVVEGEAAWRGPARLLGVLPNPSRDGCRIAYELAEAGRVSVEICDVAGREVRRLSVGAQPAGRYDALGGLVWDGRNEDGSRVAAGTYFVRLVFNGRRLAGQQGSVTLVR